MFELVHVNTGFDTPLTVAVSFSFLPTSVRIVRGETSGGGVVTDTPQEALLLPLAAVIVALPGPTALTFPSESTVTTEGLELVHVRVAPGGVTVPVSF